MSFQDDSSSISEIIRVNPVDLAICIVGIPQYLSNYQAKLVKYQANGDLIIQASPKQLKALLKKLSDRTKCRYTYQDDARVQALLLRDNQQLINHYRLIVNDKTTWLNNSRRLWLECGFPKLDFEDINAIRELGVPENLTEEDIKQAKERVLNALSESYSSNGSSDL